MSQAYFSDFFPVPAGIKGTTIPVVTTDTIESIQGDLNELGDAVIGVSSDTVLSKGEKGSVLIEYARLTSEVNNLVSKATTLGGFTSQATSAQNYFNDLTAYLGTLTPSWNNVTVDTPIVPATYRTYWINAYNAVAVLNAVIHGLPGAGSLAYRGSVQFNDGSIVTSGGATATDAAYQTSQGVAATISGQTDWATYTGLSTGSVFNRTQYLDGSNGYFSDIDRITNRRITRLHRDDGSTPVTEAAVVTNLGVAATVANQTDWATYTGVNTTTMAGRTQNLSSGGFLSSILNITNRRVTNLHRDDGTTTITEPMIITNQGVAATVANQTDWATYTGVNTTTMAGRTQNLSSGGFLSDLDRVTNRRITTLQRADGSTAVTEAAVVTNLGVAATVANQTDWATYTGVNTTTMAGRTQNLSSGGFLSSLANITNRRITNLHRDDGSTAVTEAAVVTSLGVAATVANQTAWATYTGLAPTVAIPYLETARGSFVSFSNLAHVTVGYNSVAKAAAQGAFAASVQHTKGVNLRVRLSGTLAGKLQSILLSPNSSGGYYDTGDYGFWTDGSNIRMVVNGVVTTLTTVQSYEDLAIDYDHITGKIILWRGVAIVYEGTIATGLSFYGCWRTDAQLGYAVENILIQPYSVINARANAVEVGATKNIGEGSLNRNSFFDLLDTSGNLASWKPTAGTFTSAIHAEATKGSRVAELGGSSYVEGESFPVKPGQRIFYNARIKPDRSPAGSTNSGTVRILVALGISADNVNWQSYVSILPEFADGQYPVGTWVVGKNSLVLNATYNGVVPRFARWEIRVAPGDAAITRALIDYLDARDQEEAATIGARAGTNVFRTDGVTILTQPEIRTSEGVAATVVNQGTGATANNLAGLNSTEGSKFAGIETGADVTSYITGPPDITIAADYQGTPKVNLATDPIQGIFKLYKNGIPVTSGVTWSVSTTSGTASRSISGSGTGTLSITGITSNEVFLLITATLNGVARQGIIKISKLLDAAPASGGSGGGGGTGTSASTSSISPPGGTTYVGTAISPLTVTAGTNGTVSLNTGSLEFGLYSGLALANYTLYGKWQWRAIGGSWADVSTEQVAYQSASRTFDNDAQAWMNEPGYLSASTSKTGLTSGTQYEFQLLLRASHSRTPTINGTATAIGS